MNSSVKESVGILGNGALGVSFFYHLTGQIEDVDRDIYLVESLDSESAKKLKQRGSISIAVGDKTYCLSTDIVFRPPLSICYQSHFLPEIVLVCCNPDRLLEVITTVVDLLILMDQRGGIESQIDSIPLFVLCANGIYFQRFRQIFLEKLEEATLFGRLPDLWPDLMPQIVGRLLRGVTIQTGIREGSGEGTIYRPGPEGRTFITGGNAETRERCYQVLSGRYPGFEKVFSVSATRLEFDKALVNLASNLLGQLKAIDREGNFKVLTVGQIINPAHEPEIRELTEQVIRVGKRVKVYAPEEGVEEIYRQTIETCRPHFAHIPSSLQWVDIKLRSGQLTAEITPTESWLLEPLIRYAKASGLEECAHYFQQLKQQLIDKLTRASTRKYVLKTPETSIPVQNA